MRTVSPRLIMITLAGCGAAALAAVTLAFLAGAVDGVAAVRLALAAAALCAVLAVAVGVRRVDGKVQRTAARVTAAERALTRTGDRLERRLEQRMDRLETSVRRLATTTERLEEQVGTVLAALGEDRAEAAHRAGRHAALLGEMAADLRKVLAQLPRGEDRP